MKNILFIFIFLLSVTGASSQSVNHFQRLSFAKENMKQIKNGESAYQSLRKKADGILTEKLVPVTQKTIVAISGDKHDYVSMGPYWYADPSKKDGLPYIRKDGQRNPESEKLDRVKLRELVRSVTTLSYAYYFSNEKKYADKAVENLKIWFINKDTKMNPNLNYGQMIPGHNDGKGRPEGLIDTYGLIEVVRCIKILSDSKCLKEKDSKALKQWFSEFVDWMLTSEIGKGENAATNNHGLAFDTQLTAYALFVGRNDIAEKFAKEFAQKRLFKQIEPDGSQPHELARTIAMHYTIFNIEHAMDMCELSQTMGIDIYPSVSHDGRSIDTAIEYILPYLGKPQSEFPYKQIKEWDANQEKLCWMIRRSTFFKPNAEYESLFNKYCNSKSDNFNWLLYAK